MTLTRYNLATSTQKLKREVKEVGPEIKENVKEVEVGKEVEQGVQGRDIQILQLETEKLVKEAQLEKEDYVELKSVDVQFPDHRKTVEMNQKPIIRKLTKGLVVQSAGSGLSLTG